MKRLARIAVAALAAVVAPISVATAFNLMPQFTPESATNPTAARGCVIRFDTLNAGGTAVVPYIYENSNHRCVGVTAVSVEPNGDLRVTNTGGSNEIVTVWAVPDETLAAKSLVCGVSGGGTESIVRCYKPNGVRIHFDVIADVYAVGSNIWFGGIVWDS